LPEIGQLRGSCGNSRKNKCSRGILEPELHPGTDWQCQAHKTNVLPTTYSSIANDTEVGKTILLADGTINVKVLKIIKQSFSKSF